jgi:hypothetical protein
MLGNSMHWLDLLLYLTAVYPLMLAWGANRRTSLVHSLSWALATWTCWCGFFLLHDGQAAGRYLALCLTGCTGIAVLGARRPIVGPWNLVLLGLLAVLLLPLGENALMGTPLLDPLRLVFLAGTLAVGVLNYLPTRLAVPVLMVGLMSAAELYVLAEQEGPSALEALLVHAGPWLLAAAAWIGWGLMRAPDKGLAEFDGLWLAFRNRFGLMWGQRVREQFNEAAKNADWPVVLRWSGLRRTSRDRPLAVDLQTAIVEALRSLLRRFGEPEKPPKS